MLNYLNEFLHGHLRNDSHTQSTHLIPLCTGFLSLLSESIYQCNIMIDYHPCMLSKIWLRHVDVFSNDCCAIMLMCKGVGSVKHACARMEIAMHTP